MSSRTFWKHWILSLALTSALAGCSYARMDVAKGGAGYVLGFGYLEVAEDTSGSVIFQGGVLRYRSVGLFSLNGDAAASTGLGYVDFRLGNMRDSAAATAAFPADHTCARPSLPAASQWVFGWKRLPRMPAAPSRGGAVAAIQTLGLARSHAVAETSVSLGYESAAFGSFEDNVLVFCNPVTLLAGDTLFSHDAQTQ